MTLSKFLIGLSLSKFTKVFVQKGATSVGDLKMFSEEELQKFFGLRIIEARRLHLALYPSDEAKKTPPQKPGIVNWNDYDEECIEYDCLHKDYPLFDNGEIFGFVRRFSSGVDVAFVFYVDETGELEWFEFEVDLLCKDFHRYLFPNTPFPNTPFLGYDKNTEEKPLPISLTSEQEKAFEKAQRKKKVEREKLLKERDALRVQLEEKMIEIERYQTNDPEFFEFKSGRCQTLHYFSIRGNLERTRNIIILFSYEGKQNNNLEAGIMEKLKKFYLEYFPEINKYSCFEILNSCSKTVYESEGPVKIETVKDDFDMNYHTYPTRSLEIEQVPNVGKETTLLLYDTKEKNISTLEQIQQEKFFFTFDQLLDGNHFPNVTSPDLFEMQEFEFEKDIDGNPCTKDPPKLKLRD